MKDWINGKGQFHGRVSFENPKNKQNHLLKDQSSEENSKKPQDKQTWKATATFQLLVQTVLLTHTHGCADTHTHTHTPLLSSLEIHRCSHIQSWRPTHPPCSMATSPTTSLAWSSLVFPLIRNASVNLWCDATKRQWKSVLTALACDGSVIPYIFPREEFSRSRFSLNLQCILSANFEADKWLYCQIVQFYCQLCSAAQEGVLHLSFIWYALDWKCSLCCLIFLEKFLFAVSVLCFVA